MGPTTRRSILGGATTLALGAVMGTAGAGVAKAGVSSRRPSGYSVSHVVEKTWRTRPPTVMFPDLPQEFWDRHPEFWDVADGRLVTSTLTWVLRRRGRVVLIDTGIGNDKERPATPDFHHQRSNYLQILGIRPEDVDVVINTHLHTDHVGWNTRLVGGDWVPTFPNATYVFPEADYDYFRTDPAAVDSVMPVVQAGQAVLWSGT